MLFALKLQFATFQLKKMNLLEIASSLVFLMTVAVEAIVSLRSFRSLIFPIWLIISLLSNIICIHRAKPGNFITLPMVFVVFVNLLFIGICFEALLIWPFEIVFPRGHALCKSIKCVATTSALVTSLLLIYILILFRYTQTSEREVLKNILLIFIVSPIITLPQVRFEFSCLFVSTLFDYITQFV